MSEHLPRELPTMLRWRWRFWRFVKWRVVSHLWLYVSLKMDCVHNDHDAWKRRVVEVLDDDS